VYNLYSWQIHKQESTRELERIGVIRSYLTKINMSYIVTGATGRVGSAIINHLLAQSVPIRAVIRSENKAQLFESRHIEVAIADLADANALIKAFQGARAVFAMNPPTYESADLQITAAHISNALATAIKAAKVSRVVILSSVGAEKSSGTGNILTTHTLEQALQDSAPHVVIIRCAWFMENWFSSVSAIQSSQSPVLGSLLEKLDRKIPQIATEDIGCTVAKYLTRSTQDALPTKSIIELEGPEPHSPNDVADIASKALGNNVIASAMTGELIYQLFEKFGWSKFTIDNLIGMVRGFDNNTISWPTNNNNIREKGKRTLAEVLGKRFS
jgi:uncharacterized protein YbjT (DUF2867 family)